MAGLAIKSVTASVSYNVQGKQMQESRQLRRAELAEGIKRHRHLLYVMKIAEDNAPVPRQNSIRMELNPRVTLLHPQAILGETGMLPFGKLLIRKVPRERGVLTRDNDIS